MPKPKFSIRNTKVLDRRGDAVKDDSNNTVYMENSLNVFANVPDWPFKPSISIDKLLTLAEDTKSKAVIQDVTEYRLVDKSVKTTRNGTSTFAKYVAVALDAECDGF